MSEKSEADWQDIVSFGCEEWQCSDVPLDQIQASLGQRHEAAKELKEAFIAVFGGESRVLRDPTGESVLVNNVLLEHIIQAESRRDGREVLFPLIPEVIQNPFEIWVRPAMNIKTEKVSSRRKYVKAGSFDKPIFIAMVAEKIGGTWTALTLYRGSKKNSLKNARKGYPIYKRP